MAEDNGKGNIRVSLFFGAMGALVALLSAVFVGYVFIDFSFLPAASCGGSDNYVYCFFAENWDSGTYLSIVSGFYNTIITILIFLLGTVAALAFIVIRGNALQQAEEATEKEVDRYFETDKAQNIIRKWVDKVVGVRLEEQQEHIEIITERLKYDGLLVEELRLDDEEETEETN